MTDLSYLKDIKTIICDVDGTLTDGGMYYGPDGEALKRFDTRDWHGLLHLQNQLGLRIVIMTGESSPSVHSRIKKLKFENYHHGIKDKKTLVEGLLKDWGHKWEQTAFIGDDDNDLPCLKRVGFSAVPGSSFPRIQKVAKYVTERPAGRGAVREVCEMFIHVHQS